MERRRAPRNRGLASATAATTVLFALHGVPLLLVLLATGASAGDLASEDGLLGAWAPWTAPPYLIGVVLFGLTLAAAACKVTRWSATTGVAVVACGVAAYVLPILIGWGIAGSNDIMTALTIGAFFTLAPFMGGWVAAACAGAWCWQRAVAQRPPQG